MGRTEFPTGMPTFCDGWWFEQIICPISSFQVPFMWLALGRNLQINAVFSLIPQSKKSMGGIIPSLVQHTLLQCFYPEQHSRYFLMKSPVLASCLFLSVLRNEALGGARVPFSGKNSLVPVTWENLWSPSAFSHA